MGKDHTLFALTDGTVVFKKKAGNKSFVSVEACRGRIVTGNVNAIKLSILPRQDFFLIFMFIFVSFYVDLLNKINLNLTRQTWQ
jgi:hypothetical protein